MFRENGIFRDVFIINQEEKHINDFLFRTNKNVDGTYDLKIKIDGNFDDVDISCDLFTTKESNTIIKNLKVNISILIYNNIFYRCVYMWYLCGYLYVYLCVIFIGVFMCGIYRCLKIYTTYKKGAHP